MSDPLAIHVVAAFANRAGGADVYSADLVRALAARGHRVTLMCHGAAGDLADVCEVRIVPKVQCDLPLFWRFDALLQIAQYTHHIARQRRSEPDIVIGSGQQLTWAYYRRFRTTPLVYVPHALVAPDLVADAPWVSSVHRWTATQISSLIEQRLINVAAATVRFTRTGCVALEQRYGDSIRPRFEVFPAPVPVPARPRVAVASSDELRLLVVGRLTKTKNVDVLLEALRRTDAMACSWRLDIVGDGEDRDRLQTIARASGLGDRVVFNGHQESLDRWYRSADLLLFPSRLESLGLVVPEAMAYGVPVLAIRADGRDYRNANHELIDDGHDGFLADTEQAFEARLKTLLTDSSPLRRAGVHARLRIEQQHTWTEHMNCYERLFARIQSRRRQGVAA
jgi:glycosyltransferase involved in cell wall biosynthesis